jgi:hypothetical protein
MRIVHAFLVVSMLLFVTGIGFVIAGARARRDAGTSTAPTGPALPALAPVASVKQIMNAIVVPSARTVFGSVGTIVTAAGVEERAPKSDAEWDEVADAAAALVESGNLMLMPGRAVDQDAWARYSHDLVESSKRALDAASRRDAQEIFSASETIYDSCNGCHQTYQRQ